MSLLDVVMAAGCALLVTSGYPAEESAVSSQSIGMAMHWGDALLQWVGGAAPTLIVLMVLVMSGVPPYAGIVSDLLDLLRLLVGAGRWLISLS